LHPPPLPPGSCLWERKLVYIQTTCFPARYSTLSMIYYLKLWPVEKNTLLKHTVKEFMLMYWDSSWKKIFFICYKMSTLRTVNTFLPVSAFTSRNFFFHDICSGSSWMSLIFTYHSHDLKQQQQKGLPPYTCDVASPLPPPPSRLRYLFVWPGPYTGPYRPLVHINTCLKEFLPLPLPLTDRNKCNSCAIFFRYVGQ
jgi:hypothetical protein